MQYFRTFAANNADKFKMYITESVWKLNNLTTKLQVLLKEFRLNQIIKDQILILIKLISFQTS